MANDRDNQNLIIEANDISIARITLKNVLFKFDNNTKFICDILADSGNSIKSEVTLKVYGTYFFYFFILQLCEITQFVLNRQAKRAGCVF